MQFVSDVPICLADDYNKYFKEIDEIIRNLFNSTKENINESFCKLKDFIDVDFDDRFSFAFGLCSHFLEVRPNFFEEFYTFQKSLLLSKFDEFGNEFYEFIRPKIATYSNLYRIMQPTPNETLNSSEEEKESEDDQIPIQFLEFIYQNPLLELIRKDDLEGFKTFLNFHPTIDIKDEENIQSFLFGSENGRRGEIISYRYPIDRFSYRNTTNLLNFAAFYGSSECFKYFIMNDCNIPDDIAEFAIYGGNNEIIRILEQKGVNYDNKLQISIDSHHYHITDWLLTNYNCEKIYLYNCIKSYNYQAFLFFISKGEDPNARTDFMSYDSLAVAAKTGSIWAAKYLIEKCIINFDTKYTENQNIIHIAIICDNILVLKYLVETGKFDVNWKDVYGYTPLHKACNHECKDIFDYLIQNESVDITAKDNNNKTPLDIAVLRGNDYMISKLSSK